MIRFSWKSHFVSPRHSDLTEVNVMSSELEEKIKASLVDGRLPCPVAFQIAKELKVSPGEIGEVANKLSIKVSNCQLGCFP